MNKVVEFLNANPVQYLATVGRDGKAKCRPFMFAGELDGKLWFCTNNQKDVYKDMQENPEVEISVSSPDYLDLATGLRRGELLGLKWTDVDLDRGVLKIQRAISRQNGKVVEAPLKTKNAYRTLPLSADAIDVLMQQRRKTGNSEWVFPSPTGGPMSPDSVLHMLQRVLKRAGLPRIRFHDLRHTFATMALQNGVDVKTVSSMLGHYSAGFTLDTYAHVTTDAQLKAAQTMGNILSRAV